MTGATEATGVAAATEATGVAVVTGASRGIGRAAAEALARRGLRVAMLCRRLADTQRVAASIGGLAIECDVSDAASVARAAERVQRELGTPTVVVNNAGVVERALVEDMTEASWDHVVDVNLKGPFLVTRAFLASMKARGAGRIVHVGSISSTLGTARATAYNASKWGLVGFMKSLAEELRGTGLQTMAVLPGSVDTDMLVGSGYPPQMTAEEVASTIVWAALDASPAHHGAALEMFGP